MKDDKKIFSRKEEEELMNLFYETTPKVDNSKNKVVKSEKKELNKKEQKDLVNLFYDFNEISIDDITNEHIKKTNNEVTEKNKKLNGEIAKLKKDIEKMAKEIETLKNMKTAAGKNYNEVFQEISKRYSFLSCESQKILSTAEYQYLNEKDDMDYSGVYLSYIKVIELELKKRLGTKDKNTFGNMLHKLEKRENLKTFVNYLYANQVLDTRNKAVHDNVITKNECGKIRKILIEDGWLSNLIYVLDTRENPKVSELERIEVLVVNHIGNEIYLNRHHNVYDTAEGKMLLTKKQLKTGNQIFAARKVEINGIEFYLV